MTFKTKMYFRMPSRTPMPFISTLMGWLYLGEVPVLLSLVGGLFAIAGVWIVNQSCQAVPVPEGAS